MSMTQLLFSFKGRLNRQPYWLTTIALIAIVLALVGIAILVGGELGGGIVIFVVILYIPLIWIGLALGAKRLHDRNKSAWWLIVFYVVPGVLQVIGEQVGAGGMILMVISIGLSIWALVELGFLRGTSGPNCYGPDPLGGTA